MLGLVVLAGILLAAMGAQRMNEKPNPKPAPDALRAIIARAATAHGVPVGVALAFCEVESGFNQSATGDRDWAKKHPDKYHELVVSKGRAYADRPELWHSYGLFQLLSVYFTRAGENPELLYDPVINADRGCAFLAGLLKRCDGDPVRARLAYVGCGSDGHLCSPQVVAQVRARISAALERYGVA